VKDFGGLGQLAGKRVGVLPRSAAVDILRSRGKAVVREFQTPEEAFDALALGKIYAVCVDLLTAAQFVKLNDEYRRIFKIYHDPVTRKEYVIAVKGGKSSLLNKINSGIDRMKREGALNTLVDKWFFQE
jgi:ABC-type amino acid transport substrate-binding protein